MTRCYHQISILVMVYCTRWDGHKPQSYMAKFALNKETILFIITILSLKSILSVDLRACDKSIVCGCKVAV